MTSEKLCYSWLMFDGNAESSKPVANASIAKKLFQKKNPKNVLWPSILFILYLQMEVDCKVGFLHIRKCLFHQQK